MRNLAKFLLFVIVICLMSGCKQKKEDTYKIGVIFPMSEGGQSSGLSAYNALQMCADEWNKKGGILGKKIVFDLQDSKGDPKEGMTIAKRMVSVGDKPDLIISAISGVTLNVQSVTEKEEIILMGIIGADDFLSESQKYSLRNFITSQTTSNAILDIVRKDFSHKNFKIAYCNTELGRNFSQVIKNSASHYGVQIAEIFSFEENETNYKNEILKHNFNDNDVVYVIGVDRPLGLFIRQLRQNGFKGTIIGDINIINSSCVDVIGEYLTNIFYINVRHKDNSEMEKYKSLYGNEMDVLAIYCYNGLDLLLNFIDESKNMDSKYIMSNINGYEFDSKIGLICVKDNELNYEHELIEIK